MGEKQKYKPMYTFLDTCLMQALYRNKTVFLNSCTGLLLSIPIKPSTCICVLLVFMHNAQNRIELTYFSLASMEQLLLTIWDVAMGLKLPQMEKLTINIGWN